jgi:hypothetical protein
MSSGYAGMATVHICTDPGPLTSTCASRQRNETTMITLWPTAEIDITSATLTATKFTKFAAGSLVAL